MVSLTSVWDRPGYSFRADDVAPLPIDTFGDPDWFAGEQRTVLRPGGGLLYVGHDVLLPAKGYRRADGDPRLVLTPGRGRRGVRGREPLHPFAAADRERRRTPRQGVHHVPVPSVVVPQGRIADRRTATSRSGAAPSPMRSSSSSACRASRSSRGTASTSRSTRPGGPNTRPTSRIDDDFAGTRLSEHLDFDGWSVLATDDAPYRADWKAFLEVFGDCYHVPPYHEGLSSFTDCNTLDWTFGPNFHVQFLDMHEDRGGGSPMYTTWHDGLERYHKAHGEPMSDFAGRVDRPLPEHHDRALPRSAGAVDRHPHRSRHTREPGALLRAHRHGDARSGPAGSDEDRVRRNRRRGRRADREPLRGFAHGSRDLGLDVVPYHTNLTGLAPEAGTAHFYDWYRREMASSFAAAGVGDSGSA